MHCLAVCINWAVNDYNNLRPYYKHKYLTPYEAYFNIPLGFDVRKRTLVAMKARVASHKNSKCIQCQGFRKGKKCGSHKACAI